MHQCAINHVFVPFTYHFHFLVTLSSSFLLITNIHEFLNYSEPMQMAQSTAKLIYIMLKWLCPQRTFLSMQWVKKCPYLQSN